MGSWLTFNIPNDAIQLKQRTQVLDKFFAFGGGLIDSSPMYGRAEEVLGRLLRNRKDTASVFRATKVWTPSKAQGPSQLQDSTRMWGANLDPSLDLVFVHNLLGLKHHLPMLEAAKAAGQIKYTGYTTSHGRRHHELENLISSRPSDFVQFSYNVLDREAERRLLPAASDSGMAVVINRPFRTGLLFQHVKGHSLPGFAADIACENWAQFFLKFVISHPAVTCAIPATSNPVHMAQNMGALAGPMPNAELRAKMAAYVASL